MLTPHFSRSVNVVIACCALAFCVGCSHAEYDLLRPPDVAQHIGTKQTVVAPMPPLEYRMLAYENHLVIRIYNHSDETIQFLAGQSTVVDPNSQSHPLPIPSQMILPGSYIKLILPPTHGLIVPTGPTIGIGIGGVYGSAHGGYRSAYGVGFAGDPFYYDYPRYYAVYSGDQSVYWGWNDGGAVRLVLTYRRVPRGEGGGAAPAGPQTQPATEPAQREEPRGEGPGTFTHEFVFKQQSV